jgi:Rieske Fe-S protein
MRYLTFILLLFVVTGCDKCKSGDALLQPYPIDVSTNINEPAFFDLTAVSGWVYYNAGSAVLILYRKSLEEVVAYDNRSTYNIDAGCSVKVQQDNIIIKDDCSTSQWIITDGTVTSGPATRSLLQYTVDFNYSTGALRVFN